MAVSLKVRNVKITWSLATQKLQRAIILEHKKNMKAKGPTFDVLYERKAVKAQEMPTGIRRGWFGVALR